MDTRNALIQSAIWVGLLTMVCAGAGCDREAAAGPEGPTTRPSNEFVIDDYTFQWRVAEIGNAKMVVEKTEDATTVLIWSDHDLLRLTPADAEALGGVLSLAGEKQRQLQGDVEKSEQVKAGNSTVTFDHDPKYGFSVSIRPENGGFLSTVTLDRKAASAFAPHMKKAGRMAAFVDGRIRPNG